MNDGVRPIRLFNIYGFTGMNYAGNVWDINGLSPALNTMSGGNRQPLIMEEEMIKILYDDTNLGFNPEPKLYWEFSPTLRANRFGLKIIEKEDEIMSDNVKIRKLTPTECYKLMGFTAEDCKKCSEGGISNSQLYKQAGNSIVVNVLEAIFTSLGENYEEFKSAV